MAHIPTGQEWRSIAEQASTEMDPAKLTSLVAKLCASIDDRHKVPQIDLHDGTLPAEGIRKQPPLDRGATLKK
jgi:hypothetical protein